MREIRNPYEVLQIPNFSDLETIKKKYRTLALTHHPDRGGDQEMMKEVNSSYDLLCNHKPEIDEAIRRIMQPPVVVVYTWYGGNGWTNATTSANGFY